MHQWQKNNPEKPPKTHTERKSGWKILRLIKGSVTVPQHYSWLYSLLQLSSSIPKFTSPKHLTLFSPSQLRVPVLQTCHWKWTILSFLKDINKLIRVIWRRQHFNEAYLILHRGEGRKSVDFREAGLTGKAHIDSKRWLCPTWRKFLTS